MDSSPPEQAPLVEAVRHADDLRPEEVARFRRLFDEHFTYVWTSLRRLGVPEREREDLSNEVFFRVHRRISDYDPARPGRPWLFAFAVRVVLFLT